MDKLKAWFAGLAAFGLLVQADLADGALSPEEIGGLVAFVAASSFATWLIPKAWLGAGKAIAAGGVAVFAGLSDALTDHQIFPGEWSMIVIAFIQAIMVYWTPNAEPA